MWGHIKLKSLHQQIKQKIIHQSNNHQQNPLIISYQKIEYFSIAITVILQL